MRANENISIRKKKQPSHFLKPLPLALTPRENKSHPNLGRRINDSIPAHDRNDESPARNSPWTFLSRSPSERRCFWATWRTVHRPVITRLITCHNNM